MIEWKCKLTNLTITPTMKSISKNQSFFNSEKELSEYLLKNVSDSLKQAIKVTVSMMVKEEMKSIREELSEKLSFNGYYQRNLVSTAGKIEGIDIPRFRERPMGGLDLKSMEIFEKEKEGFHDLIAEMHRNGVSQGKITKIAKNCFGIRLSKQRIGYVHNQLAEQEEFRINNEAITDEFEYLYLDGIWVKCKNFGLNENNQAVLLCALGVQADGQRKIIGFKFAFKEDYESWHEFLLSLKDRGLKSERLDCIISDDGTGLSSALSHLFPDIPHQSCIAHKMRNVIVRASPKNKTAIAEGLKGIYAAETEEEAKKKARSFMKEWYVKEEKAVRTFNFNFDKTLVYFNFPKDKWKQIRTSNVLEREFREVRRRIKVFDSSFNSPTSCKNYAGSIFSYLNDNYPEHLHSKS